jgi:single-stranded-DNA-specific exonuclease
MGLRMRLREQGQGGPGSAPCHLDLVTLGTVADLVPLVEENRVLVTHGLKEIGQANGLGSLP